MIDSPSRRVEFARIEAARCARAGWDASENIMDKVEAGFRCVTDREIVVLSKALGVRLESLFPVETAKKKSK